MAACLKPGEGDVAVPVPTTSARLRRRGYNQAGLLACAVARHRAIPMLELLERRPSAESQIALPVAQRRANVEGAFRPRAAADRLPSGCHVILIDDVVTTGATVLAASRALEGMGVRAVTALAFARALPRDVAAAAASI
jgi:ComF family protein